MSSSAEKAGASPDNFNINSPSDPANLVIMVGYHEGPKNAAIALKIAELDSRISHDRDALRLQIPTSIVDEEFMNKLVEFDDSFKVREPISIMNVVTNGIIGQGHESFSSLRDVLRASETGTEADERPQSDKLQPQYETVGIQNGPISTDPAETPGTGNLEIQTNTVSELRDFEPDNVVVNEGDGIATEVDSEVDSEADSDSHDGDVSESPEAVNESESESESDSESDTDADADADTEQAEDADDKDQNNSESPDDVEESPIRPATKHEKDAHWASWIGQGKDGAMIRAFNEGPARLGVRADHRFVTPNDPIFFQLTPDEYIPFTSVHEVSLAGYTPYYGHARQRVTVLADDQHPELSGLTHMEYNGPSYEEGLAKISVDGIDHGVIAEPDEKVETDVSVSTDQDTPSEPAPLARPATSPESVVIEYAQQVATTDPADVRPNMFSAAGYGVQYLYRDELKDRPEVVQLLNENQEDQIEKLIPNSQDFKELTSPSLGIDLADTNGFISRQSFENQSMMFRFMLMNKDQELQGLHDFTANREFVQKLIQDGKVPALIQYREALTSAQDVAERGRTLLTDKLTTYRRDFEAFMNEKIREAEAEYLRMHPPMNDQDFDRFVQSIDSMVDQQMGHVRTFFNAARKQILTAILDTSDERSMIALKEIMQARALSKNNILGAIEADRQFQQLLEQGQSSQDELRELTLKLQSGAYQSALAEAIEDHVPTDRSEYTIDPDEMSYEGLVNQSSPDDASMIPAGDAPPADFDGTSELDARFANLAAMSEETDEEFGVDETDALPPVHGPAPSSNVLDDLGDGDEKKKPSFIGRIFSRKGEDETSETTELAAMMNNDESSDVEDGPRKVRRDVSENAMSTKLSAKAIKTAEDDTEGMSSKKGLSKVKIAALSGVSVVVLGLGALGVVALTGGSGSSEADAQASASQAAFVSHLQEQFPVGNFYDVNVGDQLVNVEIKSHTLSGAIAVDSSGQEIPIPNEVLVQYIADNPDAFPSYNPDAVSVDSSVEPTEQASESASA